MPDPVTLAADRNSMTSAALNDVQRALLWGATFGAAGGGFRHLYNALTRKKPTPPSYVEVLAPQQEEPEPLTSRALPALPAMPKLAAAVSEARLILKKPSVPTFPSSTGPLHPAGAALGMYQKPNTPSKDLSWLKGQKTDPQSWWGRMQIPWWAPTLAVGTPLAAYGGYKLMDWLAKSKRKSDLQAEVEDAKLDYQDAITNGAPIMKRAGAQSTLAEDLDRLTDLVLGPEKQASETFGSAVFRQARSLLEAITGQKAEQFRDTSLGAAAGTYGSIAIPTFLGSAYLMNRFTKGRDPNIAMARQAEENARRRQAALPPAAFPVRELSTPSTEPEGDVPIAL